MNANEMETFKEMKTVVKANTRILMRIDKCLNGDPDNRNDLGLVGDVRNNVRWKNNIQKILGALGFGVITLWLKDAWGYIKG